MDRRLLYALAVSAIIFTLGGCIPSPGGSVTPATPGVKVEPGTTQNATPGPQPADTVAVPSLVGKTLEDASSELKALGLEMELSEVQSAGRIVRQSPVAGTQVSPGSAVEVALEKGPADVEPTMYSKVPNVIGMGMDAAKRKIAAAGLKPVERWVHGPIEPGARGAGVVYRQVPEAGTALLKGETVKLSSWWESG